MVVLPKASIELAFHLIDQISTRNRCFCEFFLGDNFFARGSVLVSEIRRWIDCIVIRCCWIHENEIIVLQTRRFYDSWILRNKETLHLIVSSVVVKRTRVIRGVALISIDQNNLGNILPSNLSLVSNIHSSPCIGSISCKCVRLVQHKLISGVNNFFW